MKNKKVKKTDKKVKKQEIQDDVLKNISGGATSRNNSRSNLGSTG